MHSFETKVNHIFNSKLALYHLYINNIKRDRIPTLSDKSPSQRGTRELGSPAPKFTQNCLTSCILAKQFNINQINIIFFKV